ncbi:TPA: DUF2283 domain-containing protein [Candidatus Micrarchaeota archaeon]|nr:DUF2283 domain-containing protein [Candidatus Micrarchaeota archaeon]
MEKMKIIFNKLANTLDIWFDDPQKEAISEETGEEVILKKDRQGKIIGIEKLNVLATPLKQMGKFPFEMLVE